MTIVCILVALLGVPYLVFINMFIISLGKLTGATNHITLTLSIINLITVPIWFCNFEPAIDHLMRYDSHPAQVVWLIGSIVGYVGITYYLFRRVQQDTIAYSDCHSSRCAQCTHIDTCNEGETCTIYEH